MGDGPIRGLFGNRAQRRRQEQGKDAERHQPTLQELPEDLRPAIAVAQNFNTVQGMLRAAHGVEGFAHAAVHQAIEWLKAMEHNAIEGAAKHPRFAEFFPEIAAQINPVAQGAGLVDPSGAPVTAEGA